jgi:hypothetical protein
MAQAGSSTGDRANLSLGLGVATLAAWVIGILITGESGEENDWIWFLMAVLALGAIVTGFMARQGGRFPGRALVGLVLGGVFFLIFLAFVTGIVA